MMVAMQAIGFRIRKTGLFHLVQDDRQVLALFTATIFLSALLLFAVQPMFAKIVLPRLGGAPSVWAVSMCFFQAVLLAGYLYAHVLNRLMGPGQALAVHVALMAVAWLALPIGLPAHVTEPAQDGATLWLLGVLFKGVALPFFAISANAPLLQAWFGRTGHPHAADPYFLYGASNVGSLAALLAYPVIVEPLLPLGQQSALWGIGFVALACCITAAGSLMVALSGAGEAPVARQVPASPSVAAAPVGSDWRQRAGWVILAFIPSALLVAFTTYLTTDIASAPFLWVVPLAVFLLTFTMVFRDRPLIPHDVLVDRLPIVAALAIFGSPAVGQLVFGIGYVAAALAFVVTCLVLHRELYLRRPPASELTGFYAWMSLGGVLGGMFSALLAPLMFNTVIEFPLLVAIGVWLRPQIVGGKAPAGEWRRLHFMLAVGLGLLLALRGLMLAGVVTPGARLFLVLVAAPLVIVVAARRWPRVEAGAVALMLAILLLIPVDGKATHVVRSFFGVHRVVESADGKYRLLTHGTTVHGARRMVDDNGAPVDKPVPATYYYAGAPMPRSTSLVRHGESPAPTFGVIGLGSGAIACSAKPGETWRFYEIDRAVVDIARDTSLFGFLPTCLPGSDVIVGDARLTLAKERPAAFDYLLIDAFSSDSIPAHLLTVEAFQLYLDKLKPEGVLALHLSNRHLDLVPVVAANVERLAGLFAVVVRDSPESRAGHDAAPSVVVLLSRRSEVVAPALSWRGASRPAAQGARAWTDDYSDLLSALLRHLWWS
jgi:hypothetical protein